LPSSSPKKLVCVQGKKGKNEQKMLDNIRTMGKTGKTKKEPTKPEFRRCEGKTNEEKKKTATSATRKTGRGKAGEKHKT